MRLYQIHGKHETAVFKTAVAAVRYQIEEIYQYEDDGELSDRARRIVDAADEAAAVQLLLERSGGEYEGFDMVRVSE